MTTTKRKAKYPLKCSICGQPISTKHGNWRDGNNAQPINDGRCCDECNNGVVIPIRLLRHVRKAATKF